MARKYIFTDKHHTYKGIMSTVIGVLNLLFMFLAVYMTFKGGGVAPDRYAATVLLVLILAFIGIILGIIGKAESEKFYAFAYIGIILNIVAVIATSGILYAGAYGL